MMARKKVKVEDLMTRKVTCLDRNDSLDMADEVEDGDLVGILTETDILRYVAADRVGELEATRARARPKRGGK